MLSKRRQQGKEHRKVGEKTHPGTEKCREWKHVLFFGKPACQVTGISPVPGRWPQHLIPANFPEIAFSCQNHHALDTCISSQL